MGSVGGIVDISSDEEDFPRTDKLPGGTLGWVSDLFGEDDEGIGEGLDDLVVMEELSAQLVVQEKSSRDGVGDGDDDDDDCVVLDGDPDKVVTVAERNGGREDGSDELQIVGEKGQLACRDFPHPRHLCASLPFSSSSHAKHCSMCHCFVCESPAPCNYWGKGTLVTDHCHATEKDSKWKTLRLRQASKSKSLPTSHPGKLQNSMHPLMTLSQKDSGCQVAVPQQLPSLRPNIVRPSPTGRTPVPNSVDQNQKMHPITVPQHVGLAACTAKVSPVLRAGRGMSDTYVTQSTHSRTRFKRVGAAAPGYATSNGNQFRSALPNNVLIHQVLPCVSQTPQLAPRSNVSTGASQNNFPQRSLSAPVVSQAHQFQPTASHQVALDSEHGTRPQLSRCTSLTTQRTQCLPEPLVDTSKSWQEILASVASDLGVSDYNISNSLAPQPLITSQPVHSDQLHSHGNGSQGVDLHSASIAATAQLSSFDGHGLSNHTASDGVQAYDPMQTTEPICQLNIDSSVHAIETHLNSLVTCPADEMLLGIAHQMESSTLDSPDLLFDFEVGTWLTD